MDRPSRPVVRAPDLDYRSSRGRRARGLEVPHKGSEGVAALDFSSCVAEEEEDTLRLGWEPARADRS